ncbi:MAG: hypothetical protein ABJN72_05620 [Sulfitobacter sp.]
MSLKNILVIGGTGVFGKRLVRHLSTRSDVALFVSSRAEGRAVDFIQSIKDSLAPLHPVGLDCATNLQERLEEIKPFAVVDCSGPFQGAGYDTARIVLRNGAHFVDLADARDYLTDFHSALDGIARDHGVAALAGASSTPTLSTCVAQQLTKGWHHVDTIDICITPGGKSAVGRSVIEAILSYAGRDVPIWRSGHLDHTTGWGAPHKVVIPGLGKRRVAAVETFDAEHLGRMLNVRSRVSFSAGLESRLEQLGIETLAALRKRGLIGQLGWLIPMLLKARSITRLTTSDSGGMMVDITGRDENDLPRHSKWCLIARNDHGPFVPVLPAAAAIDKLLAGPVTAGARMAHGVVDLADIVGQAAPYAITTTPDGRDQAA